MRSVLERGIRRAVTFELEARLTDPMKRAALRNRLLSYPGTTEEQADAILGAYEQRVEEKHALLSRGTGNAMAELILDRKGYPRPPGWTSVFFFPDSFRLRNVYITFLALAVAMLASFWFLS